MTGVRIWDYDLNFNVFSREIKFSKFNAVQGERTSQIREGYFTVMSEILDGL